jgi:hypothetical protein
MTGTKAPLKIAIVNKTTPTPGRTGGYLSSRTPDHQKPKLFDQLWEAIRSRHYSRRVEQN